MKSLIIFGVGDFAKLMRHYFDGAGDYRVIAYCAERAYIKESAIDGLPVVPLERVNTDFPPDSFDMFVACGYTSMRARRIMFEKAREKGYALANFISPHAIVDETLQIGSNNVIFQGTSVEPFCKIGDNNILWSMVSVIHHATIHNHCFIASQTVVGGRVTVGDNCFLGFHSTIMQDVKLEEETLVGSKTLILENTKPFSKYLGIPGKCVGEHQARGVEIR